MTPRWRFWLGACAAGSIVFCAAMPHAYAQLQFAGDAPRVYTIEPRDHLFKHEITLGLGVLPLDAFYVGTAAALSYAYHFNDVWAWEALRGFYSYNSDTSLRSLLIAQQVLPVHADRRILSILSSNVVFKPMYGKLAFFNSSVVRAETYFTGGIGVAISNQDTGLAPNLGVGLNFWLGHAVAIRLDVGDHFVFSSSGLSSVLQVLLSASFNFNIAKAENITAKEPG